MTAPIDDPTSYPAAFDVYVALAPAPCPGNAVAPLDSTLTLCGQVDGKILYSYGGLGKGVNPFPVEWVGAEPAAPFAYGAALTVVYQGTDPSGGRMRACLANVLYADDGAGKATGTATTDAAGVPAYWYYEPPGA